MRSVKFYLSELLPVIIHIVNTSLSSREGPSQIKFILVVPLLEKALLDSTTF